mgnify:FL=1
MKGSPALRGGALLAASLVAVTTIGLASGSASAAPEARTQVAPAPDLPPVAGLARSDRSTAATAVSVPASGSASLGQWIVWTGRTGRSTSTTMTMPPASGTALLADWNGDGVATPGPYAAG